MFDCADPLIHQGMILEASDYKNRSSVTVVINTQTLSKYLYIHLPAECVHLDFFRLASLTEFAKDESSDITPMKPNDIIKYKDHPWIRINADVLDWSPGKHLYRLSLGLPHTMPSTYIDYYISYVSQQDNPDKPYVYMKR